MMSTSSQRVVIVVHGFASHRLVMRPICRHLRRRNEVVNWGYPSLFQSVRVHAEQLARVIEADYSEFARIDFVAHSMGSVIIRQMLHRQPLANLGRMVFITPPSLGSPPARWVSPILGRLCRCLPDIAAGNQSLVQQLPRTLPGETAVIAARYDWLAPVASTHLTNQVDHQVLHATHNSVLFSSRVAMMVDNFLQHGHLKTDPIP